MITSMPIISNACQKNRFLNLGLLKRLASISPPDTGNEARYVLFVFFKNLHFRLSGSNSSLRIAKCRLIVPCSAREDRKSTRLNSSHVAISYAVFCLKKNNIFKGLKVLIHKYKQMKKKTNR